MPGASPSAGGGISSLTVYFFMDGKLGAVHREVPRTVGVARAALNQLLAGPTSAEASGGPFTTEIPENVLLLGISIANGTATVDLSKEFGSGGGSSSMFGRLAQLTYTLTQFSNVDRVALRLDAQPAFDQPITRDVYRSFSPAILVDRPAWGSAVASPLRITGSSNVFEAEFLVEIDTASGSVLARQQVHATCGSGCSGTFDITVPYHVTREQPGLIKAYNLSAKDGSVEDVRIYQVTLTPLSGPMAADVPANINRWREQVKLETVSAKDVMNEAQKVKVAGYDSFYAVLANPIGPAGANHILGVVVPTGRKSCWFIKMTGPLDVVAQNKKSFETFIESFKKVR